MYETILTLITRKLGYELPVEVLKNICRNAVVRVPWCAQIQESQSDFGSISHILRSTELYPYNKVRLEPMRRAIDKSLNDFCGRHLGYGRYIHKYTPAHRKTPENMDIKAFCLDMERQHTDSYIDIVPRFDGWITCGKPVGKYRKFELAAMWPTLYGKGGWANKLKKQ